MTGSKWMKLESRCVRRSFLKYAGATKYENVSLSHAKVWSDWEKKPVIFRLYRLAKCRQLFGCASIDRVGIKPINMSTYTIKSIFLNLYTDCSVYTFQRDTRCSCTDCLLILRCQLYMFRTVTVHPQELLFRCS